MGANSGRELRVQGIAICATAVIASGLIRIIDNPLAAQLSLMALAAGGLGLGLVGYTKEKAVAA